MLRISLIFAAIFVTASINVGKVGNRRGCFQDQFDPAILNNTDPLPTECQNGNPCASGHGHPYKLCRNDLNEEEIATIQRPGFCTKSNRFTCVRAFTFAGCCRNPCAKLTNDPNYDGQPLVNAFGCQLRCQRNSDCRARNQQGGAPRGVPVVCTDGACCERPLFNPDPQFRTEEMAIPEITSNEELRKRKRRLRH